MDIKDDTEALRNLFTQVNPDTEEIESVHRAELDPEHALVLMANPKLALKAMGIVVSDESQVNVTMKNRADRSATTLAAQAARTARIRRIIVIVIHYRNCDADIVIIATR